jgi:hypothetical protein
MRVFISWSGERSRKVAELLDDWLQCVLQAADPWMSSKDIDRGALWFSEISDQLANTSIGIICLTKENKLKPWILFESGALAKGITSSRVCTFLIDLKPTDIENPLAQFNHTKPDQGGLWELVRTINISLKEKALKESTLEKVFDTYWQQFEERFKTIIKETPETEFEEIRSENDILLEVLSSVRMMDRRIRRIENDDNYKREREYLNFNAKNDSNSNLEFLIRDYILKGIPKEVIEDVLIKEHKVNPAYIKNMIEMYISKYNDEKNKPK